MKNKILIITSLLPKELTHLYGLISKQELENDVFYPKIIKFYEDKKKSINEYIDNESVYLLFKELKDKYKDQIIFVNQEIDNNFQKNEIDCINVHGNIDNEFCLNCNSIKTKCECESKKNFFNIVFKEDKNQYKEIVELVDKCQHIIFMGSMGQLDPTLFLDEMVNSLYINIDDANYLGANPYVEKKEKLSMYFDEKIIVNKFDESIDDIKFFIDNILNEEIVIHKDSPYKDNGKEIVELINVYFDKIMLEHNITKRFNDRSLINKLKKTYPFVSKLPETYVGNIWYAYCNDTNKIPHEITYDDLFYDMLLVYSKYKWIGMKKYFTNRPKISLTQAYNENNDKKIEIFKKLILKKDYIE